MRPQDEPAPTGGFKRPDFPGARCGGEQGGDQHGENRRAVAVAHPSEGIHCDLGAGVRHGFVFEKLAGEFLDDVALQAARRCPWLSRRWRRRARPPVPCQRTTAGAIVRRKFDAHCTNTPSAIEWNSALSEKAPKERIGRPRRSSIISAIGMPMISAAPCVS